jgi:hypothetical protein
MARWPNEITWAKIGYELYTDGVMNETKTKTKTNSVAFSPQTNYTD